MRYPDTVKLVAFTADGYGDKTISEAATVPASFIRRSMIVQGLNMDGEASDAAVYLDHRNSFVLSHKKDLEGMYVEYDDEYYRIGRANVAERKLLNNKIDNIYCRLEKSVGPNNANIS